MSREMRGGDPRLAMQAEAEKQPKHTIPTIERAPGVEREYTPFFPSLEELASTVEAYMELPANQRTGYMQPTMDALHDVLQHMEGNPEGKDRLLEVIQAMSPGDTIDVEAVMAGRWDGTKEEADLDEALVTLARSEVKEESILEKKDGDYQVAKRYMAAPYWTLTAVAFSQTEGVEPDQVRTRKQESYYTWLEDQDNVLNQHGKGVQGPRFMSGGATDLRDW